jgi:acyl carrier protein
MSTPLTERVRDTVAATLNLPPSAVDAQTSADNNDAWDSLAQVNLMLAIEQTFDIELDVEDFMSLTSVQGIALHLAAQGVA